MSPKNCGTIHPHACRKRQPGLPALSALALALLAMVATSCPVEKPDWTVYEGTNLLPGQGFDHLAWIPDGDPGVDANADSLAETRTADSYDGTYLGLTRVDTLQHGLQSAAHYTAADSGFADATALYAGLSADALLDDGSTPPVYRLEVKNLFRNGDFESSTAPSGYTLFDLGVNTASASLAVGPDPNTDPLLQRSGNVLRINLDSKDYLRADLQDIVAGLGSNGSSADSYNLNLLFFGTVASFFGVWSPETSNGNKLFTFAYTVYPDPTQPKYGYWTRYPWAVKLGTEDSSLTATALSRYFYLNLGDGSGPDYSTRLADLLLDDIQLVKVNQGLGLRLKVPFRLLGSDGTTALRPELASGGTYTLKFEVRLDPTVTDNQTKRLNSFPAEYLSVLLQNYDSQNATTNENPTQSRVFSAGDLGWNNGWVTVSLDWTSLIGNDVDLSTAADGTPLLEIFISPTHVSSSNLMTPGSLLVTAPRLYYSPEIE